MRILLKIIIFFLISFSNLSATNSIVYIDLDYILAESNVGKKMRSDLENIHKKNIEKFSKSEKKLKEEEKSIISQKNLLKKDEYEKKIIDLREKVKNYRVDRKQSIDTLTKKRIQFNKIFLKNLNPILADYSKEKSLSLIIKKTNVVVGKSELDITNEILKIVNQKVKNIKVD